MGAAPRERPGLLERPLVVAGLIALLCLIWGSTWFAIKIGLQDMPPFFGAGLRYLLSSALIGSLALLQGVGAPRGKRTHLALLALGLGAFGLSFGVVYWGEQYVPAGLAAVLFATHPLLVSLVAARLLPDEGLTIRKLIAIAVGFFGVAVLMLDDVTLSHPRASLAAAIILVSPLAAAFSNVLVKKFGVAHHPYSLTALPMLYGGCAILVVSALSEDWGEVTWSGRAVAAVGYLAVFGSCIAVVTYYWLLKHVSVSRLALISYLFPVVAVLLDVALLGERFGTRAWLGSALVVTGVALGGIRRRAAVSPVGGTRG